MERNHRMTGQAEEKLAKARFASELADERERMEADAISADISSCREEQRRIDEYIAGRIAAFQSARKTDIPSFVGWYDLNEVHMLFDRVYDLEEGSEEMAACRADIEAYREAERDILGFIKARTAAASGTCSRHLKGLLAQGKDFLEAGKALEKELSAIRRAFPSVS